VSWRRGRAARGKVGPGKLTIALLTSLVLLLAVFGLALSSLFSTPGGSRVSLTDLQALASGDRIVSATLQDQDDVVVLHLRDIYDANNLEQAAQLAIKAPQVKPATLAPTHVDGVTDGTGVVKVAIPSNGSITTRVTDVLASSGVQLTVNH